MKRAPKNWIHKHVALQQATEQGFRPVAFRIGAKLVFGYVPAKTETLERYATACKASEIICGVTALTLWKRADEVAA